MAQAGKNGFLYVFDRVTGKPIWPIEEKPVPQSDVPGEHSSPTQPIPTAPPPFVVQKFGVDDINPYLSADEKAFVRDQVLSSRNDGMYTPPSLKGTTQMPSNPAERIGASPPRIPPTAWCMFWEQCSRVAAS